jgi:hypothetical protein
MRKRTELAQLAEILKSASVHALTGGSGID